jgi:hypothetical protein
MAPSVTRKAPWPDKHGTRLVMARIRNDPPPSRPSTEQCGGVPMSDALWDIISDCCQRVPCERPLMTSVVTRLEQCLERIMGFVIIACW